MGRHPRTARIRDNAASARQLGDPAPNRGVVRGALLFLAGAGAATLIAIVIGTAADERPQAVVPVSASAGLPAALPKQDQLVRLGELLNLSDADLANIDIARLNLAATEGLQGADGLDIDAKLAELDRWAKHVEAETVRNLHRFRSKPADYEDSEAYFRALMLITVLQRDLGVHYSSARIDEPDFTNSKDLFLHGLVGDSNGGTCVSMPVLYVAIGRRLGYPMTLALAKGHVFARWDGADHPNPSFRGRFNIEGTNRGLNTHSDEHYAAWPHRLSEAELSGGWYLRSLEPEEELAVFLMMRGHCLEDTDRLHEAQVAYAMAHRFAPRSPEAIGYLANALQNDPTAALTAQSGSGASNATRALVDDSSRYYRPYIDSTPRQIPGGQWHQPLIPSPPRPPVPPIPGPGLPPHIPIVPR